MGRGGRTDSKCRGKASVLMKNMDSEDSDEDYVAEIDDVDDQSEELDSLVGDGSEEESFFEAEGEGEGEEEVVVEEEEEEQDKDEDEDDDDDDDDDDEEWRTVVKPKARKVKLSARNRKVKGSTRTKKAKKSASRKRSTKPRKNGVGRPKKRRRVNSDDDEDSDDDDEEFTPDEEYMEEDEDFEEEDFEDEEFPLLKKNTKKRGRTKIKENTSVKSQKKRSAMVARKPRTKKSKVSSSRRTRSNDDEDFLVKGPTLRDRSRKKPAHRQSRVTAESDSDFCSDPSDYEFTISEEEREQVKEANQICGRLATNLRSSRRNQEDEAFCEPKPIPVKNVRKGKEKVEEKKNDVVKAVCGICLTEEGKNTTRGTLNCCSHYFCFACIFEWSKVETRCPLCKQRFVSISKPARCVNLRDTVIPVPERDQVYQPSEEELRDFLNPYENVICTECHLGGEDALMLLCDLCDSPAHTFCVGLGYDVPEGNWYCDGCRPAALGSSHSQTQDPALDQRTSTGISEGTSYENMAEIDLNVSIPETPVSQGNGILPSPRLASGSFQPPSPASGMGVSTVSGRRLIHAQIRRHFLSNRFSQISPRADSSAVGNLAGRDLNSTQLHRWTDAGPSHHAQFVDRLQENPSHSVRNRDSFPGSLGYMMRGLGQPSTSANGFAHSQGQQSELDRLNLSGGQSQVTVSEQLRSSTSRSNVLPNIGVSQSDQRYGEHTNFLKQQVHIMVRTQLKSLSRDMNLAHNDYVEISRRSAYSILAAYGLEPPRHDTCTAQAPTCFHLENRLANIAMSPMNGCCMVCFEGFVKDVVNRMVDIVVQPHWSGFRH